MSGELELDGRELLSLAEEAPEQVEVILEMMNLGDGKLLMKWLNI